MKKGKYARKGSGKSVALLLALILVLGIAIGGTIAWLTDTTREVTNTFTTSNIDITLTEEANDFQMVPGHTIEKDPIVTVLRKSEDAWVFVKVNKSDNLDDFISYEIDPNNWTKLDGVDGVDGVYYTKYESRDDVDISIKVLKDNMVTVNPDVTKEDMDAIVNKTAKQPTLSFTAYACQYMKDNTTPFTPAEAWKAINETP